MLEGEVGAGVVPRIRAPRWVEGEEVHLLPADAQRRSRDRRVGASHEGRGRPTNPAAIDDDGVERLHEEGFRVGEDGDDESETFDARDG